MGFQIVNGTWRRDLSTGAWDVILRIARRFGWEPAGTIDTCSGDRWEGIGSYLTNDRQLVGADDATELANALLAALTWTDLYGLDAKCMPTLAGDPEALREELECLADPAFRSRLFEVVIVCKGGWFWIY